MIAGACARRVREGQTTYDRTGASVDQALKKASASDHSILGGSISVVVVAPAIPEIRLCLNKVRQAAGLGLQSRTDCQASQGESRSQPPLGRTRCH